MRFCNLNEAYTNSYESPEEIEEKQNYIVPQYIQSQELPETQSQDCTHCKYFIERNNKDNIIIVLIIILLIVILMK